MSKIETMDLPFISNQSKKARKAKVPPKPKRPLSSFNLFYRFKREKVISLGDADRDAIITLVKTAPGLEEYPPNTLSAAEPHILNALNEVRRRNIRKDMENNLLPTDTRHRSHRMNHKGFNGAMSFLELGKLMNTSWQECDEFAKTVFRELADEGRELYRKRLEQYNETSKNRVEKPKLDPKAQAVEVHVPIKKETSPMRACLPLENKATHHAAVSKVNEVAGSKRGYGYDPFTFANISGPRLPFNQELSLRDHQVLRMASNSRGITDSITNRPSQDIKSYSSPPTEPFVRAGLNLSGPCQFFNQGGFGNNGHLMSMARAQQSAIPTGYNAPGIKPNLIHRINEKMEGVLHARMKDLEAQLARTKELEAQLATAKLEARVLELESGLARQRAVENSLRAELLGRSWDGSPAAASARHQPGGEDGLSFLASASMLHPSVQSSGSVTQQMMGYPSVASQNKRQRYV